MVMSLSTGSVRGGERPRREFTAPVGAASILPPFPQTATPF